MRLGGLTLERLSEAGWEEVIIMIKMAGLEMSASVSPCLQVATGKCLIERQNAPNTLIAFSMEQFRNRSRAGQTGSPYSLKRITMLSLTRELGLLSKRKENLEESF